MEWCQALILILNYDLCVPICYGSSCHKLPRIPQKYEIYTTNTRWNYTYDKVDINQEEEGWTFKVRSCQFLLTVRWVVSQPASLGQWLMPDWKHFPRLHPELRSILTPDTRHQSVRSTAVLLHPQLHLQRKMRESEPRACATNKIIPELMLRSLVVCDCEPIKLDQSHRNSSLTLASLFVRSILKICKRKFLQGKVWYLHVVLIAWMVIRISFAHTYRSTNCIEIIKSPKLYL